MGSSLRNLSLMGKEEGNLKEIPQLVDGEHKGRKQEKNMSSREKGGGGEREESQK